MEARTEVAKKTPGDLKREEVAWELTQRRGGKWEFFRNYPIDLIEIPFNSYFEPGKLGKRIFASLKEQKKAGQIEGWLSGVQAFDDNGEKIHHSVEEAVYIELKSKPKAQVR